MSEVEKNNKVEAGQFEKLSVEKAIDLVRQVRNDLIKDFLLRDNIQTYFAEHYNKTLSPIRLEFLIRDLKELLISPVDLVHYSSLIKDTREINSADLSKGNTELFYKELDMLFNKYKY